jgi:hypothetical protein
MTMPSRFFYVFHTLVRHLTLRVPGIGRSCDDGESHALESSSRYVGSDQGHKDTLASWHAAQSCLSFPSLQEKATRMRSCHIYR